MVDKITSTNSKKFKYLKKLYLQPSKNDKFIIVEGPNQINSAFKKNIIVKDYSTILSNKLLNKISKSHQGQIAVAKKPHFLLTDFENMNKIIILDNIQDPGNVGTIIRTAVAFNIDGIILINSSVNVWSPKVIRSTAGSIFNIPILQNVKVSDIKKLNHKIYVTVAPVISLTSSTSPALSITISNLKNIHFVKKAIIVFGNEANGISEELLKIADEKITIPHSLKKIQSLNVAIAAGIVLYEATNS